MNLLIDAKMILLLLGIGYGFTFILISAFWHEFLNGAIVKTFLLSKCVQFLAWFLLILRGEIPDWLSISLGNSILLIGAALEIMALLSLQYELRPMTKLRYALFTGIGIVGFQLILVFCNVEHIRIVYCSIVMAIILLPTYRMALGKSNSPLMRVVGCLYLIMLIASLTRGATALFTDKSTSYYIPGMYQLISLLTLYLITTMGNMGFVLLLKEKTNQELVRLASYDDLTGALNRRTFAAQAKLSLTEHAKQGVPLSYLLFDIDWFKTINDTYGHHVGDLVLQDLAARIKQHLDKTDLFVRYGGDEFGILLPHKDEAASDALAERINQTLTEAVIPTLPAAYTISLGILTLIPDQDTQLETLYNLCDQALYDAKRKGRNSMSRAL